MQQPKMFTPSHEYASVEHFNPQNHQNDQISCITLPKVKCAFHPNQTITNFCTCQSCLLPLCPACIKIHTLEHVNMKKINPQYQPITELLQEIYGQVQDLLTSNNQNYQKITEIDARVGTFRTTIQQKIGSVKQNIINEVQKYFAKLDQDIQAKIDNMNYIQMVAQYKDQIKKVIVGLKNVEKCFNPDNDKIMRIVIKYKGESIKKEIQEFQSGFQIFMKQINNNFVTFSVREDYKQIIQNYLESVKKIQVSDVRCLQNIPNVSNKLREVYDKPIQQSKKQIRKSIGNFLNSSNAKVSNQENEGQPQFFSRNSSKMVTPSKQDPSRRSLSKGKGLSLMHINNTMNTSIGNVRGVRAVNITQPIQFNRTTIIRRDR